jgi:hypothetical protein
MIKTEICAGVCGLNTTLRAESGDGQNVVLDIQSECPDIRGMADSLKNVDAFTACFGPMIESPVYILASSHCSHAACPVPSGIIKTLEAACQLALPADVTIKIEKE